MIKTRQQLKEYLDCERRIYACGKMRLVPFLITESQVLWRHAVLLRKTEYYYNTRNMLLYRWYLLLLCRLQNRYGMHIPINVFDKGLNINHTGPIVVNAKSRVGVNCRLNAGVTIGENKGARPVIGNNVYIGPGAKIFGGVIIADRVNIGANAVVTHSCETEGATLTGIPATITGQEDKTNEPHDSV